MTNSPSIKEIAPAFVAALAEIGAVTKDSKNPFLKNKYASLDAIISATKPILSKHGLAAFQVVNDDGINTIILHTSGEWIGSEYLKIMSEASKGLSTAQAVGVSITYAKRYQLGALLNVSTEEDTDGQYGDNKDLKPTEKPAEKKMVKHTIQQDDAELIDKIATAIHGNAATWAQAESKYTITPEVKILIAGKIQSLEATDGN